MKKIIMVLFLFVSFSSSSQNKMKWDMPATNDVEITTLLNKLDQKNLKSGKISKEEKYLMNKIMTERRKKHWAIKKNIVWMDGMPLTFSEIQSFNNVSNLQEMLNNLVDKKYLKLEKPKKLIDEI